MFENNIRPDKKLIQEVWEKAKTNSNLNSNIFRKDKFDAWIKHSEYNKIGSMYAGK